MVVGRYLMVGYLDPQGEGPGRVPCDGISARKPWMVCFFDILPKWLTLRERASRPFQRPMGP